MTTLNGMEAKTEEMTVARRLAAHISTAIEVLLRPPRALPRVSAYSPRQWLIGGAVCIAIFLVLLVFIDAASVRSVQRLPHWITWSFDQITDYGKSGWFLWPLGLLFLALAALDQSRLTRVSQAVLAAVMVRVGFLFLAIGMPGLTVAIVKRMIGRARPLVGGQPRSLPVRAVHLARRPMRACPPATPPPIFGAGRLRHAVAARAHGVVDLCAGDRGEPARGDRALSERRLRRGALSAPPARCWCAAISRSATSAFRSGRTACRINFRGRHGAGSRRSAGNCWRTRRADGAGWP